jgi:hypothetical protein
MASLPKGIYQESLSWHHWHPYGKKSTWGSSDSQCPGGRLGLWTRQWVDVWTILEHGPLCDVDPTLCVYVTLLSFWALLFFLYVDRVALCTTASSVSHSTHTEQKRGANEPPSSIMFTSCILKWLSIYILHSGGQITKTMMHRNRYRP